MDVFEIIVEHSNKILCGFVIFIIFILTFLHYHGFFHKIVVKATQPPYYVDVSVAYKFTTNYSYSLKLLKEAQELAPHLDSFSIYHVADIMDCEELDTLNAQRCSMLKFLLISLDSGNLRKNQTKQNGFLKLAKQVGCSVGVVLHDSIDDSLLTRLSEAGFKNAKLPAIDHAVVASCPFKSHFSLCIAIHRAYPMIRQFIRANNLCAHPIMELYTMDQVYFIAPLSKQFSFYAEESEIAAMGDEFTESSSEEEEEYVPAKRNGHATALRKYCNCDSHFHSPSCDKRKRNL